jgi:hypothetical protein
MPSASLWALVLLGYMGFCGALVFEPRLVNQTLQGERLRDVEEEDCAALDTPDGPLRSAGIHIIILAAPKTYTRPGYGENRETLQMYADLHGYRLRTADPVPVMRRFGGISAAVAIDFGYISTAKSLAMLCKPRHSSSSSSTPPPPHSRTA